MSGRIRLFLSSYVPLFAIAAIRVDAHWVRFGLIALAVLGLASLLSLIRVSRRIERREAVPSSVRDLGSEVAAYLATYLLPFVMVGEPDGADLAAYALTLLTIAVVFVKSDLVGVNPLLYLLGYRVYAVAGIRRSTGGAPREAVVISRDEVETGRPMQLADLAPGTALVTSVGERPHP